MSQIAVYSHSSGPGSGTVTSVTGGTGITITGNPAVNPTVNLTVPVSIANGGTNATSFATTDGVVYYDGTRLVTTSAGVMGQVLTSNGPGMAPTFQAGGGGSLVINGDVGSVTGNPLTFTGGTSGAVFTGVGSTMTESFNFLALPSSTASPDVGYISIGGTKFMHSFGSLNVFLGENAGNYTLGAAVGNTGIGYHSLISLVSGSSNTAIGYSSLSNVTTGSQNTAVGDVSLASVTIGNRNTGVGSGSLAVVSSSSYNTGIGYLSLSNVQTGLGLNTALGYATATALATGASNIFIGDHAGSSYTTSESSNIIIANTGTIADNNTIRIGTQGSGAGQQNKAFMAGIIGVTVSSPTSVVIDSVTGQLGVAGGGGSPIETLTGDVGGAISPTAGNINITGGSSGAVFTGAGSTLTESFNFLELPNTNAGGTVGYISFNTIPFIHNYGTGNFFLGEAAGNFTLTSGVANANTAVGYHSMEDLTTGTGNVAVGILALASTTDGTSNIAIGGQALQNSVSDGSNVAIGGFALNALNGADGNTAVGQGAMQSNVDSPDNVAIGLGSLDDLTTGNGSNTSIGESSLTNLESGEENIAIGSDAGQNYASSESNNIVIGNDGVLADNNVIRIGTQGSGVSQQNTCFIAGIVGVTTSNSQMVTINSSTGQLGAATIPNAAVSWSVITADQNAVVNTGYICNKAGLLTLTLPTTAAVGSIIRVTGINTALGWKIAQNSGQTIYFGSSATTTGATGSLASAAIRDTVEIVCVVANNDWNVLSSIGNITVV